MIQIAEILNASILIIDNQAADLALLEEMLTSTGYKNLTSTMDAHAAHSLQKAHHYDLILLDLQLLELLRPDDAPFINKLKHQNSNSHMPLLAIMMQTAQTSNALLRALQMGVKDFINKPFDLAEVQTRVHNLLEMQILYRRLANYDHLLEQTVLERTAELRASEARFKSFTELSSDWYWEQDAHGKFTKISGPVLEMLGIEADGTLDANALLEGRWNSDERAMLEANIANRRPFLDFVYSRIKPDGTIKYLQVSGEPMFDSASRFIGYRGIGIEITDRRRVERIVRIPGDT